MLTNSIDTPQHSMERVERQFVLRLPPELAKRAAALCEDVETHEMKIECTGAWPRGRRRRAPLSATRPLRSAGPNKFVFLMEGQTYPVSLGTRARRAGGRACLAADPPPSAATLPTVVESYRTLNRKTYFKSNDVGQVFVVHMTQAEADAFRETELRDGLTPPTRSITSRRFAKTPFGKQLPVGAGCRAPRRGHCY